VPLTGSLFIFQVEYPHPCIRDTSVHLTFSVDSVHALSVSN